MENIKQRIAEIIGEASMCWSEIPTGEFNSNRASELVDEIMTHIPYTNQAELPRCPVKERHMCNGKCEVPNPPSPL